MSSTGPSTTARTSRPNWTCQPPRGPAWNSGRVNVDFPAWMIEPLDREAQRLGVNRQSIIKLWIAERLERGVSPLWFPEGALAVYRVGTACSLPTVGGVR